MRRCRTTCGFTLSSTGNSPSRNLLEIVFRVDKAERDGGFILHVIHISGKRMKASGVDGLSRGE